MLTEGESWPVLVEHGVRLIVTGWRIRQRQSLYSARLFHSGVSVQGAVCGLRRFRNSVCLSFRDHTAPTLPLQVVSLYKQSFGAAITALERASASKNAAVVCRKLLHVAQEPSAMLELLVRIRAGSS